MEEEAGEAAAIMAAEAEEGMIAAEVEEAPLSL
jgi:hypothetical protein